MLVWVRIIASDKALINKKKGGGVVQIILGINWKMLKIFRQKNDYLSVPLASNHPAVSTVMLPAHVTSYLWNKKPFVYFMFIVQFILKAYFV